jgi:hypothetical protein
LSGTNTSGGGRGNVTNGNTGPHDTRDAEPPGQVARVLDITELHAISSEELSSFAEAEQSEQWRVAMIEKMNSINDTQTWILKDLPKGHRVIVCLVVKGYVQKQGIDFEEVFPPVPRCESVRLLLGITGHFSWEVHHMDVKSAFPNGRSRRWCSSSNHPASSTPRTAAKCCAYTRSSTVSVRHLELRTRSWTSRSWSSNSSDASWNTACTRGAPCELWLIVRVYVDDLIITNGDLNELNNFKQEMLRVFKMSDLGALSYYLGIEVHQKKMGITIS